MIPVRSLVIFFAVLCWLGSSVLIGQETIKKRQTQLQSLRKEINIYEKKIKESAKKERSTLDLLDIYDRQAVALQKLIRSLHQEALLMENDIETTRSSINDLNNKISFLKRHYARYIAAVYKSGQTYDLELLLSSKSLNQVLIRSEYLKRFSDQRKQDIERIGSTRDNYEEQSDLLQRQLSEQHELIAEKAKEEKNLKSKAAKRKLVLQDIRRDKKNYQKEVTRKLEAVKEMERLIAKLIEEDLERREREAKRTKNRATSSSTHANEVAIFEAKRGRYRWPIAGGKIVSRFGNHENPVLHTITQNTGIDISTASGTTVEAITEGEVSTIWWLPSFGNLVILSHNGGYRTVYAHMSEISVSEGDRVAEGESIGKSGEALSGPLFHFELWRDREKQDPEQWLRPRGMTQK